MPFDWNHFLTLAEELARKPDEASKRTAISRAYYSIFNAAFSRAETTIGPKPPGEGFHQWCWDQYTESGDHSCQQLGLNGNRMKAARVKADYRDANIPRLDDLVRRTLEDARQLQADLAALDPALPRP